MEIKEEWTEYYVFLEELRQSGVTNMFGATPYLREEFGLGRKGTSVSNIIKLMHDNISMNDIRPIDVCDIKATLEHPAILGNFAISLGQQATVYNMPKDKEEKV